MNALQWTEQYRPHHLSDVYGHEHLRSFLQNLIDGGAESAPHLILHGPPGTGKTSLALAFATDMYPAVPGPAATMYLNASDERTIETVRERIREFLRTYWVGVKRKIVIFDEVETMTEPAQLTLRALMDTPPFPDAPVPLFIFLCNTLSRIVPLIRSRALALFCGHLSSGHITELLEKIAGSEGRTVQMPTPLACLVSRGDMRSFIQRAQEGENPNVWLPWFQRLLNVAVERMHIVWEDGLQRAPMWILLRNLLLFCYSMGIPKAAGAAWAPWLETVMQNRSPERIVAAWCQVVSALRL